MDVMKFFANTVLLRRNHKCTGPYTGGRKSEEKRLLSKFRSRNCSRRGADDRLHH